MKAPLRADLTPPFLKGLRPADSRFCVWDTRQPGLAVRVHPGGRKTFVAVYQLAGRSRWYTFGAADRIGLADARDAARRILARAVLGQDAATEKLAARAAARAGDTLGEICERYLQQVAKKKKAWAQGEAVRQRHLLPRLRDKKISAISRGDIETIFDSLTAKGSTVSANQFLAHSSAVFTWAVKKGLIIANPCSAIARNATVSRARVLEGDEVADLWDAIASMGDVDAAALRTLLLIGARPGEVRRMRQADLRLGEFLFEQHRGEGRVAKIRARGGWWDLPGAADPNGTWPGTKNGRDHRVRLSESVVAMFRHLLDGSTFVFHRANGRPIGPLAEPMRDACSALGWKGEKRATAHDLRRTHGTAVTSLGFTREQMNRLQNHVEGGIADVYDRSRYEDEGRRIQEAVCARLLALAERRADADNVIELQSAKG